MTKKRIRITDGGVALPLGNNTFLMRGRLHSQGGIGIGNGGKNDIEVEDGEIVKFNKNNIQVLSDQPMLNGISPANALLAGGDFNKIFKAQQSINGNYGGSYGKDGLIKRLVNFIIGDNKKENNETDVKKKSAEGEPIDEKEVRNRQGYAESGFDSNAGSGAGARGLFQIMPSLLIDYNNAHGTNYTVDDLYNDEINTSIRDWKMGLNLSSAWATKNAAPDSVVYAKALGGYNMGNTDFIKGLEEAKKAGVDIYNSMDWIDTKWFPKETVDYINFVLRNQDNSAFRNQAAYEASKKLNKDKVDILNNNFKNGGKIEYKRGGIKDNVRKKLYRHIYPSGYTEALPRIIGALLGQDDVVHTRILNDGSAYAETHNPKRMKNKQYLESGEYADNQMKYRDDLFATYLGIPKNERRKFNGRISLIDAKYKPTVNKLGINTPYYTFPTENINWRELLNEANGSGMYYPDQNYIIGALPSLIGQNITMGGAMYDALGEYTIGRGYDPNRGEYISLYDLWDIAPFGKGDSEELRFKNAGRKDKSFNIGNPVQIYDRMYLDDYYGLTGNERGGYYIPEVTVTPKTYGNVKVGGVTVYKNGGQINMKLKHKNKQDITDIVMNEILPHSTGERRKFNGGGVWGTSEWSLAGNLGLNALNALGQGVIASITGNKAIKTFKDAKSKLKKIFTPVAREHIDTRVDIENELSGIRQSTAKLIENAQANTSNKKVARLQAQNAIKQQNELEHRAYTEKYREEGNRRDMAAKLATQYNIIDNQNYIQAEREYQDKMLQLDLGIANAEMSKGQTWGNAAGSALKAGADSLTDYATMTNDLLKSNNPAAYAEYMKRSYGRFLNPDGTLKDKYKGNTKIENFYNKNLKPLFPSNNFTPQIITYNNGLLT